ncbi:MAG TPA: hypothetical protein VKT73_16785 [Xanthobacteraceae bacterium]|nr:hypothetical protein [Xanthobacteraceae bacterium]
MNSRLIIGLCSIAALGFAVTFSAPASAERAKSCSTQWRDMTKDQKGDQKKKDWVANCEAKAAAAKGTTPATTPTTTPSTAGGTTGKPGRLAMYARERACGKEWREAKAAGKIEKGQTWPKYWHECDQRMKAQGM